MPPQSCCVGIDLGTTFSSLAYVDEQNRLHSLRAEADGYAVASAVYFHGPDEIAVGTEALNFSVIRPDRVARAFKRHMGDDGYRFECDGKAFRAEELSAMVLKKLLASALEVIGPVDEAVISVPAYFDEVRRQATVAAGRIAGLTKVDLINEPEAAALAYGHTLIKGGLFVNPELNELFGQEATLLVFDLGGGTFDVTIARYGVGGKFEVIATDGDIRLGGEEWDLALLEHVSTRYYELTGYHPRQDPSVLQELLLKCVESKKTLSERRFTDVTFSREGKDYKVRIPVGDFERLTAHLVNRTEATTSGLIARLGMNWSSFDRILLVGGSSRMPMIGKMMSLVTNRQIDQSLSPDTAIAQGAALYAALRSGGRDMKIKEFRSVNSHPLGLRVRGGVSHRLLNDVLLPANRPTGTAISRTYRVTPGKKWGRLLILQGEDLNPDACVTLGHGLIGGLPADTAPGDVVEVTFCFQENGLLRVTAVHTPRAGGNPTTADFTVEVEGTMTEPEIAASTTTLRGISID
jgi:molecular chaperone DnaK